MASCIFCSERFSRPSLLSPLPSLKFDEPYLEMSSIGRFSEGRLCFLYAEEARDALAETDCEERDRDLRFVELSAREGSLLGC